MKTVATDNTGGYDAGYRACSCFWGREPGSLVRMLVHEMAFPPGTTVLDVGCGEGKNAAFLGGLGMAVRAVDVSPTAIANARRTWGDLASVKWEIADVRQFDLTLALYDVVIAYGLLHCLRSEADITATVRQLQDATVPGGFHVVCAFNDRAQDLSEHTPAFAPRWLATTIISVFTKGGNYCTPRTETCSRLTPTTVSPIHTQ